MSDNYLRLIPTDPTWSPASGAVQRAIARRDRGGFGSYVGSDASDKAGHRCGSHVVREHYDHHVVIMSLK